MILCNDKASGNEITADPHFLPAAQTNDPLGFITAPTAKLNKKPAPFMASFSSQGPNTITPEILKPDITAPGVNIIAAYTQTTSPTGASFDKRKVPSSEDPSPDWSPSAIRFAIMTTARTRDNTLNPMKNASYVKATPFSYGAGHIQPNRAMDPGLVYDLTMNDYLDFLCAIGYNQTTMQLFSEGGNYKCSKSASLLDFNYTSIAVPKMSGSVRVSRRLKNVGSPGTYGVRIRQPVGISVSVEPKILKFNKIGEEKSFKVTLEAKRAKRRGVAKNYAFGGLIWSDGKHYVRSPIVVA